MGLLSKMKATANEYPRTFWTLIGALFVDRLGGALIFPFLSLYITAKFNVGMTQVGTLFIIFAATNMVGSTIGGALADKFGRKALVILGLIFSSLTMLLLGLVNTYSAFMLIALIVGVFSDLGGPAAQAMVADLLPEKKRLEGFGILRVVANLAVVIGPAIGGLLAARSYMSLFIIDAISSTITAVITLAVLPETKPEPKANAEVQSLLQTITGYLDVVKDKIYMAFLIVSTLEILVYVQMNTTLSVYLRDMHGITPQQFGYIISLNAAMVVLFQFSITRVISKYAPMLVMAAGTAFYLVGFTMYGFTNTYLYFLLAMVIITIGEMLVSPTSQALVARMAPELMRARYMAAYGYCWTIPVMIGPLGAGLIMDNLNPAMVWYLGGIICGVSVLGFLMLHRAAAGRIAPASMPADETGLVSS